MSTEKDTSYGCTWKLNTTDETWETSCAEVFEFSDDGPKKNGFLYCPFCGEEIFEEKKETP